MIINGKKESVFLMPKTEITPAFNPSKPSSEAIPGNTVLAIESMERRKQEKGISQDINNSKLINTWTERTLSVQTGTTTLHFYKTQ